MESGGRLNDRRLIGVTRLDRTTVGLVLATEVDWRFYDADYEPRAANIKEVRQGTPLTDEDCKFWL